MVKPAGKNVNYINAIEFLGGTTRENALGSRDKLIREENSSKTEFKSVSAG